MAHKTRISGTTYTVKGGKTRVGGTTYGIKSGKTRVKGTTYDIKFAPAELVLWDSGSSDNGYKLGQQIIHQPTAAGVQLYSDVYSEKYQDDVTGPTSALSYMPVMAKIISSNPFAGDIWLTNYCSTNGTAIAGQAIVISSDTYSGYIMFNVPDMSKYDTVHIQMRHSCYSTWNLNVQTLSGSEADSEILQTVAVGPIAISLSEYTEYTATVSETASAQGLRLIASYSNTNLNKYPAIYIKKIWLTKN